MSIEINKRIPSLDGLRAISIFLVVFGHAFRRYFKLVDLANLGVRFFFIISAYLIVGILFRDIKRNSFSIKTFYFKRVLRTFPAFYVYLLILFIFLNTKGIFHLEQFWRAPIYLENYHPRSLWNQNQWFVGHTWSLAVEEQFYILISLIFLLLNRKMIKFKHMLYIFIGIVFIVPLIRISYLYFKEIPNVFRGSIHRSFETVADSLAIGGILALLPIQLFLESKYFTFFKNKIWILLILILIIQMTNSSIMVSYFGLIPRYVYNLLGLGIIHISFGIIMLVTISFPKETFFSNFLNNKIVVTIGLWSYSIYLWQQVWLYSWDFSIVVKFIGILICSSLSYYLVEVKFLNFRDKALRTRNINN